MRKIQVREEVCIGCHLCEIYCAVQHSKSKHIIKAFKLEKPKPTARIVVEENGPLSFAVQCRHCDDAPCVEACLTGAMHRDNGKIICDLEKCAGCWTCIMVCPYGAVRRGYVDGRMVALKCDLCPGLDVPACVAHCPNEALRLVEVGEPP